MDIRQSQKYAGYMKETGWSVEKLHNNYFYVRKFPVIGGFVKLQRPKEINFGDIEKIAKKNRVWQFVVEPVDKGQENKILRGGFERIKSPFLPSKSVVLYLNESQKNIKAGMKKDTRYCLRKFENSDVVINEADNLNRFHEAWKGSTPASRYRLSVEKMQALKNAFKNDVLFLLTSDNSGAIFLKNKTSAYYYHAFTSSKGRRNFSQYGIVWEGIVWAKKNKCMYFDFEGVYDERFPLKSWRGFSRFKKGFGGEEVEYPGAFRKWRLPIL